MTDNDIAKIILGFVRAATVIISVYKISQAKVAIEAARNGMEFQTK